MTELPGFKDNYLSGEGTDDSRSGHDDVVSLSQHEVDKASREKPSWPRENMKWNLGAAMHLISVGEHLHVFLYTLYRRGVEFTYLV